MKDTLVPGPFLDIGSAAVTGSKVPALVGLNSKELEMSSGLKYVIYQTKDIANDRENHYFRYGSQVGPFW
jgi:hypothetical protein